MLSARFVVQTSSSACRLNRKTPKKPRERFGAAVGRRCLAGLKPLL